MVRFPQPKTAVSVTDRRVSDAACDVPAWVDSHIGTNPRGVARLPSLAGAKVGQPASSLEVREAMSSGLLTVLDVSEALSVCTRTVRRLIWSGRLRSVRVGRSVRVSREALEGFLAGRGVETGPEGGAR